MGKLLIFQMSSIWYLENFLTGTFFWNLISISPKVRSLVSGKLKYAQVAVKNAHPH